MNITLTLGWWMIPALFLPTVCFIYTVILRTDSCYDSQASNSALLAGMLILGSTLLTRYL